MSESASPDYTAIPDYRLPDMLGDDAMLWATAFCQHAKRYGFDPTDEGLMLCWFANAIEAAWEKRVKRAEPATKPITPDTCIHAIPLTSKCSACDANSALTRNVR